MLQEIRRPGPCLAEFVDCFWYMDGALGTHRRERALPTGTVELVVNLRDDAVRIFSDDADLAGERFPSAVVCGPQPGYFVLAPSSSRRVIGVHFRPGGAAPFLGMPADEFTGRHVSLEDVWGRRARELRERLLGARGPGAMFDLLERQLLERLAERLSPGPVVLWAARELAAHPAVARIGLLTERSGYSSKRFITLFKNSVGLAPKMFSRVQRFQAVLRQSAGRHAIDWARVAADSGYSDQSHLVREFRAFAGITPGEYRPVSPKSLNHVPIGT